MGFFDLIENEQDQAADPVPIRTESTAGRATPRTKNSAPQRTGPKLRPRPERLKFLKPCPICRGKEFTHGKNNGFFCNPCQPGIEGAPVLAGGAWQPPETVDGLPCAGCGSTTYQRIENGFIFDDLSLADGWHCGGENCSIKLFSRSGNTGPPDLGDRNHLAPPPRPAEQKKYSQAGFPWIMAHLSALLAAGWTRPELFRRSAHNWPVGQWGVAWLSAWTKPGLKIDLDHRTGVLCFRFTGPHGKPIKQSIRPGKYQVVTE